MKGAGVTRMGRSGRVIVHGTLGRPHQPSSSKKVRARSASSAPLAFEQAGVVSAAVQVASAAGPPALPRGSFIAGLETLARRASSVGVPVRVGAAWMIGSPTVSAWGWTDSCPPSFASSGVRDWAAGQLSGGFGGGPRRQGWVLRVPPGWGARVRGWIEEDGRCNAQEGAPALVVEESPWVFLPVKIAGESWPRAESWAHAFVLLGVAGTSGAVMVPRTLPDLVGWLSRGDAGGGRRPFAPECAQLLAWDLLCAAVAWERARAAWWLARHARGHRSERAASEWQHQAAEWGIRILPPHVNHSVACAYAGGLAVRLGLGQLGAHAADLAEVVAKERANAGAFHSRLDFASRVARAGGAPRAVAAVMLSDALAELPVGVTALLHEVFPREVFLHEMPLREVLSLEVPAARHANTSPRSRAKGGPWPYLPFTVIAHDPGPPALRSASGALPRTAAECRGSS